MENACRAIVLLALALIAVVIPVYILTVSLLGKAIEEAKTARKTVEAESRKGIEKEIDKHIEDLETAKEDNDINWISDIKKNLKNLEKEKRKLLRKAEHRFHLLTVRGCVVYPGSLFLMALILGTSAQLLVGKTVPIIPVIDWSLILWLLALASLALGAYRLYQGLVVVQDIAITTSEEAYFKKVSEALRSVLKQHELSKRPELELQFKSPSPLVLPGDCEKTIACSISLKSGNVARLVEVWFFAPARFQFLAEDQQTEAQLQMPSDHEEFPGFRALRKQLPDLKKGFILSSKVTIRTPLKKGHYRLGYCVACAGFKSPYYEFEVRVE